MAILRRTLNTLRHARITRAAKATIRFMLVISGLVVFGISFILQLQHHLDSAWTPLGLLLICTAALFYDPENPPNQTRLPMDEDPPLDTGERRRRDDD